MLKHYVVLKEKLLEEYMEQLKKDKDGGYGIIKKQIAY